MPPLLHHACEYMPCTACSASYTRSQLLQKIANERAVLVGQEFVMAWPLMRIMQKMAGIPVSEQCPLGYPGRPYPRLWRLDSATTFD
ncbi:hypothetical protein DL93DRAFT_2080347 [Clavulina sp. PMI_390]|nr:hypothetical protein DL93DRAFT_2080347 [Clavulina sp. PMI_390]